MTRVLLILVSVLLIWRIAGWAFGPPPPKQQPLRDGGPAFGSSEKYLVEGRAKQRKDAFNALEKPWSSFCSAEGRKEFVSGLGHYYYHRQNQSERYPETFGKPGADYIARQWATSDDKRIERLTQETYSNGYLKPDEFEAVGRKMILAVIKGERVTGKGCSGR